MTNNQDPLSSAGKAAPGSAPTDRDYSQGFKHKTSRNLAITLCFLLYTTGILTLYLTGLKLLALLLTLITTSRNSSFHTSHDRLRTP